MTEEPWSVNYQQGSPNGTVSMVFINHELSRKTIRLYEFSHRPTLGVSSNLDSIVGLSLLNSKPVDDTNENTAGAFRSFIPLAKNRPLDPWTKIYPVTFSSSEFSSITSILRSLVASQGSISYAARNFDTLYQDIPHSVVWNVGHEDDNLQPLTFAAGEFRGCGTRTAGGGAHDFELLFTSADA